MGVMNDPLTNDLFPQALLPMMLQGPTDLEGFRRAARALIAKHMLPEQVSWHSKDSATQDLFAPPTDTGLHLPVNHAAIDDAPAVSVPPEFMELCKSVILHSDKNRFGLLYRILWRLAHEPALRHDPLDPDMVKAQQLAHAVRRDMHKMKAFVRFRTVQDDIFKNNTEDGLLHVAWFEPEHHIVETVAPFFARRFAQMRWAILTPACSAEWDGAQLRFGPGGHQSDAPPADAGEQLWLTYYQNIFNPARLKLKMMEKEMPRKYWHNLPEAALISTLTDAANERSQRMVQAPATFTMRRLPAMVAVEDRTKELAGSNPTSSLVTLKSRTDHCRQCPIGEHATQSVCGEGPRPARLMLVGEQPGDQEDLRGHPFVGPAGQLLNRALVQLGVAHEEVFVTNAVKHFKYELRGKRRIHKTPSQSEAAACLHWLDEEITLVKPKLLVALGATAARSLMGRPIPVMAHRGQILTREDGMQVLVTLHPSALLRLPDEDRDQAYVDWLKDLDPLKS
jgi:probable DNA metabolism protein